MSNRAERRAAERTANKTANKAAKAQSANQTNPNAAQPMTTEQLRAAARASNFTFDLEFTNETVQEATNMSQPEIGTPKSTASEAQINANRQNAQNSTGAKTVEGKATVSQNRRTHGLIGQFAVFANENMLDFLTLKDDVIDEYQPQTPTEWRLAQSLIQHYWLMLRAVRLQEESLVKNPQMLPLYIRYHTTHERSYYRAQKELQKLVKERSKEQIGFEQQNTKQEAHQAHVRLQNAKAESIETDTSCKKVMGVPLPGLENVPFKDLAEACSAAIASLAHGKQRQNAAAA